MFPALLIPHRNNLYQFQWTKSIFDGVKRTNPNKRPFFLSRSGTAGIQRFGNAMWSGDIASTWDALNRHNGAQKHMSMAGIDYFGSDVGGFHRFRCTTGCDINDLYTQWFASAAWTDVPLRPHAWDNPTAPSKVGRLPANLFNVRQRYELAPYYYSLAHRAYRFGEPLVPGLFFYYQNDRSVAGLGNVKMVGRNFVIGTLASPGRDKQWIYAPVGSWVNLHTGERFDNPSAGRWLVDQPQTFSIPGICRLGDRCVFTMPVVVRLGAIVPAMYVDQDTKSVNGERWGEFSQNKSFLV
jgi:alpha-glucosidase